MPYHRKQTRLPSPYYLGPKFHFVTLCCDLRQPYLAHRQCLLDSARRCFFVLHAYCLMPDHVHILAQGTHSSADLTQFIRILKSRTSYEFRHLRAQRLWEMSYYDHILRSSESPEDGGDQGWAGGEWVF